MKRVLLVLLCALALCVSVSAHSGRTDANGGHTDSSTGEYHYHHGYPAHQHTDIDGDGKKDCPYDFDDKTGWNSGTTTSGKGGSSTTPKEVEIVEVEVIKEVTKEVPVIPKSHKFWEAILIVAIIIAIGRIVTLKTDQKAQIAEIDKYNRLYLIEKKKCEEAQKQLREKAEELDEANFEILWKQDEIDGLHKQMDAARIAADKKLNAAKESANQQVTLAKEVADKKARLAQKEADEKVETYKALLGQKMGEYPLLTIAKAPRNITIGSDGKPCVKDAAMDWGYDCTYYVANSTWKSGRGIYHRRNCQVIKSGYSQSFPMHFAQIHGSRHLLPCKLCIPEQSLPAWQEDYIIAERLFKSKL